MAHATPDWRIAKRPRWSSRRHQRQHFNAKQGLGCPGPDNESWAEHGGETPTFFS